jgi:hypothetical protein
MTKGAKGSKNRPRHPALSAWTGIVWPRWGLMFILMSETQGVAGVALGWLVAGPLAREEKGIDIDIESCPPNVSGTRRQHWDITGK